MANTYVNKVVKSNGEVLIDISDSTAIASDVTQGKTIYLSTGEKVTGTNTGGTAAISVVDTADSHGGTVRTITALDISDTTAVASDVAQGKYFYTAAGVKTAGTSSGGSPSVTQHSIYLEFTDETDTTIPVYYNDSFVGSLITESKPSAYGQKEISLAQLDGVTWYEPTPIPLNTQLVDYTKCTQGYVIDENGDLSADQWSYATDYTPVASGMTFEYTAYYWFYIGMYDESKDFISSIYVMNDATQDPNDGNIGHGTLSGNKLPSNVAYVRMCGTAPNSSYISLIRTA